MLYPFGTVLKGKVLAIMENLDCWHCQGGDRAAEFLSSPLRWHNQLLLNSVPGLTLEAELPSLPGQEVDGAVTSWGPESAFMFSITVFETLIFLWRSWALVSENTGPDPSKTPLPWQRRPNINIRQILLSSAGEKRFPAAAPLEPDSLCAVKCWSSTNTRRKPVIWI